MAKIIKNAAYVENDKNVDKKGLYLFDAEDGKEAVELVVWLEKSKANKDHPEGKPWIRLPKGNVTNRQYFSEDLFKASAGTTGEVVVEIKTAAPRVLGATGVKQDVVKYLSAERGEIYTKLVEGAVEAFKAAKGTGKKKKPEEMNKEELEAYIAALRNGVAAAQDNGLKSFMDMFSEDEYKLYNELLAESQEAKANAPKVKKGPLTEAEKKARAAKRTSNEITKAEALLAKLGIVQPEIAEEADTDEDTIDDEDIDADDEDTIDEDELTEEDDE